MFLNLKIPRKVLNKSVCISFLFAPYGSYIFQVSGFCIENIGDTYR